MVTPEEHRSTMHTPIAIVIVEDDPLISQFLSEVLSDEGYTVRVYPDGRSGLAAIIAQPPALVLLDLNLPSMAGEDVLVHIRHQLGAALPVVIMTASTQRQNWVAQGATAFLAKPFDVEELLTCVARYAAGGDDPSLQM
jgi:two-component system response regulator MtrA